jgi:hypothetical protein
MTSRLGLINSVSCRCLKNKYVLTFGQNIYKVSILSSGKLRVKTKNGVKVNLDFDGTISDLQWCIAVGRE